jgi:hypothetical protein
MEVGTKWLVSFKFDGICSEIWTECVNAIVLLVLDAASSKPFCIDSAGMFE